MARIELRDCIFRVVDGHANTAAVMGTPALLDSDIDVDTLGVSGVLPPSARFTIAGDETVYRITAQEGGSTYTVDLTGATTGNVTLKVGAHAASANILYSSNATQVKAAIVLTGVAAGDVTVQVSTLVWTITFGGSLSKVVTALVVTPVTLTDGTNPVVPVKTVVHPGAESYNITFTPGLVVAPADGTVLTVGGRTVEVKVGDGNFQYTDSNNYDYLLDRGDLDSVREGDAVPMDIQFDFVWDWITGYTGSGNPTVEDALKKRGEASDWKTSSSDTCEPYAVDIEVEHIPPCTDELTELFVFPDFRSDKRVHDVGKAQVNVTGRCKATEPIITRY